MTASPTPRRRVTPRQVADLLAQARSLSAAGPHADPAKVVAYLAAKADLLGAITDPEYRPEPPAGTSAGHICKEQR